MPPLSTHLVQSRFNLNPAGVAGFFGGDEAVAAMASIHLYNGRRWLGWYNPPGSGAVAKCFGRMANSRFWDGLFPGPNDSPAISLGLDGKRGPQYLAALSGTSLTTGHLGYLTMERSKEIEAEEIQGRKTLPINVGYLVVEPTDHGTPIKLLPFNDAAWGLIPISISVVTCTMCALVYDWFSFSAILVGMTASGLASVVIGKGKLLIEAPRRPAPGVPPGHGILIGENEVVVIKGKEGDVNIITKGRFDIKMYLEANKNDVPRYHTIGLSSILLLVQILLQLVLIPQGSFFGQLMFLVSLGVSWIYITYLSSLEKEKIQVDILFEALGNPRMLRFCAGTRTTMSVFVCLLLFHGVKRSSPEGDRAHRIEILHSCIPNDTPVWMRWKDKVVEQLLSVDDKSDTLPFLTENTDDQALSEWDGRLLRLLLDDASAAFRAYIRVRDKLPIDSSDQDV